MFGGPAFAQPSIGPGKHSAHPATCDGQSVVTHLKRARALIRSAYDSDRSEPKRSEIEAAQDHKLCVRVENTREAIGHYRDRLARKYERAQVERRQWGACTDDPPAGSQAVLDCIAGAAAEHGQSYSWLVRVASCESHLNPRAYNPSGASGLFQFMPSTFASTPYGNESIWSARSSSLAAAWMFRVGRASEWVCN